VQANVRLTQLSRPSQPASTFVTTRPSLCTRRDGARMHISANRKTRKFLRGDLDNRISVKSVHESHLLAQTIFASLDADQYPIAALMPRDLPDGAPQPLITVRYCAQSKVEYAPVHTGVL
jgi:hypothetical protein